MSEEGGHGNLLWETNSWAFSNSENSGGSDEKSTKKHVESSSNSPSATTAVAAAATGQKRGRNGVTKNPKSSDWKECKDGESDHEIHIWTERERRKKMRNMFSNLHALLPQLPAKADKSTIVDEAVNYIRTLQHSLQKLQKQRLEMVRGGSATGMDYEASMAVAPTLMSESREAYLADQGCSKSWAMMNSSSHGLSIPRFPQCLETWSSPNVVLSVNGDDAQISICTARKPGLLPTVFYILEKHKVEVITAHIVSDYFRSMFMIHAHANGVSNQYPDSSLAVEEIYKLAVGEIIIWLSS